MKLGQGWSLETHLSLKESFPRLAKILRLSVFWTSLPQHKLTIPEPVLSPRETRVPYATRSQPSFTSPISAEFTNTFCSVFKPPYDQKATVKYANQEPFPEFYLLQISARLCLIPQFPENGWVALNKTLSL